MSKVDNRTIAKNTMYMYLRMLVTMVVALFTTRIVYNALGIDNYGIYNIVGSVIVFMTFINSGLTTATRRYITAELAQGTEESQQNVFNLSLLAHLLIILIVVVLGETVGLWVVNNLLNIPEDRMLAANIVYQLSIFGAVINMMQSPFTAAITANERMGIYAYISIFDVLARLAVAYCVLYSSSDKLIIYAALLTLSITITFLINVIYCYRSFSMCHLKKPQDRSLLKEIFGYMGWNLGAQLVLVFSNQGVSVLVNMFFTVAANAAMGISNQITNVVNNFVTNFQVAFNPQITKQYVSKDYEELNKLALRSSRYSSYLVLIFFVPICCQISNFLTIWLGDYPKYAVEFCILTLVGIFFDAIAAPLWMIMCSDKDVKKYQIVMSSLYAFNFIGAWIFLSLGWPPYGVIFARIIVSFCAIIARLKLIKERVPSFPSRVWIKESLIQSLIIMAIPFVFYLGINKIIIDSVIIELLVKGALVFILTCTTIFFVGFTKGEKDIVNKKTYALLHKKH